MADSHDNNRQALRIQIDTRLPAARVVKALNGLVEVRGKPERLRLDHGPEFVKQVLARWAEKQGVRLQFIQPGKPAQNAYVERFNQTCRTGVLNCYVFEFLKEVRRMSGDWMFRYNNQRRHASLGRLPLIPFAMAKYENLLLITASK